MTEQEKLEDAVARGKEILDELNIKYGNIASLVINRRASWWGQCRTLNYGSMFNERIWKNANYEIAISERLLKPEVSDDALMNTVIHELLHSTNGGHTHKGTWKKYANLVSQKTKYHITRCTSAEEKGLERKKMRYSVICPQCGEIGRYSRWCKRFNHIELCMCGKCRNFDNKLYVIDNETGDQYRSATVNPKMINNY